MGEQPCRPYSAGDCQTGPSQRGRLSGAGIWPRWQHRPAPDPAEVRTVGTCSADYAQESSSGDALGKAERRGILMKAAYVPETGDFVWLTFDPQAGREQAGRRPALVLSPRVDNRKSLLGLVCPITNQGKGFPFEVGVPAGHGGTGV